MSSASIRRRSTALEIDGLDGWTRWCSRRRGAPGQSATFDFTQAGLTVAGVEHVLGGMGSETYIFGARELAALTSVNGNGSGTDTVVLAGGDTFDLSEVALIGISYGRARR